MGITTKKGDCGKTLLLSSRRVSKDDIRIDACGVLDELCSFLGLCRSSIHDEKTKKTIEEIQRDLFMIGSEMVTEEVSLGKLKKRIDNSHVLKLEKNIIICEKNNKFKNRCFSIPGENLVSSFLDVSRTIARRLERKTVTLKRKKLVNNPYMLVYLNRLSDLLYLLARLYEKKSLRI
ncbi:MAG: cob(I)yrinic acid a,c-diamide adenosyltransferase [Candidatus Omnitrophota bacterium]|jgi:cob(I)alamin adenosyltransferase